MELCIYKQKKNIIVKVIDKKNKIYENEYHNFDLISSDETLKNIILKHKVHVLISSTFVFKFENNYPLINKKKVIDYHKNQLKLIYPEVSNIYKLKIKKNHNNYEVKSLFLDDSLVMMFKKLQLDIYNSSIVGDDLHYDAYLYLNDYELSLWINDDLKYQMIDVEQNSSYCAMNVLKTLYYYLYKGPIYIINEAKASNKMNQMIHYLKQNVEKQVEVIEI